MIERISIDGTDLDLATVFASVTIRHGRASVDDGPLGSTATLSLVEVDRPFSSAFLVGVELEIDTTGAVPRFRGRITDASLDAEDATLALLAVSTLARISGRPVGAGAWPAESWSARVTRAFTEAGELAALTLEIGDENPGLAARLAEETTLADVLEELAETVPAAIADLPNGSVLVQAVTARKGVAAIELDPALVALAPEWAQADDVRNVVRVAWSGGEVEQQDAASIALYDEREPLTITTTLANLSDATERALLELTRRARPDWIVERADLLALDASLEIGSALVMFDQPAAAPRPVALGMLEGWTDHVEPDNAGVLEWSMALALSPARLSGYGATWATINPAITWATVDPALTWTENEDLIYA